MEVLEKPRLWRAALVVMLAVLALVGFWPSPVDAPAQGEILGVLNFLQAHGVPPWANYTLVEKTANVALFIPLGMAATLAYPDKRWWQNAALGLAISGVMELGQLVYLHNRFSSLADLVTNASGSVIGALLAVAALSTLNRSTFKNPQSLTTPGPTPISVGPGGN